MNRELPEGHMARYRHHRAMNAAPEDASRLVTSPKGGQTEAFVYNGDVQLVAYGVAVCRPDETFNRRLGRTVALGRALVALERGETPPPQAQEEAPA